MVSNRFVTPVVCVPTVIALCGPAGAGKSTVADYLVEKHGAVRASFAAPLKQMLQRALDFTDEQLYGTQAQKEAIDERYNHSPVWLCQKIGTDGCRATYGEDFFTKQCMDGIVRVNATLTVIEDCRFVNEADAVHLDSRVNGFVLRLHPVDDDESRARAAARGDHKSEQEWRDCWASFAIQPKKRGVPELLALVDEAMKMIPTRNDRSDGAQW